MRAGSEPAGPGILRSSTPATAGGSALRSARISLVCLRAAAGESSLNEGIPFIMSSSTLTCGSSGMVSLLSRLNLFLFRCGAERAIGVRNLVLALKEDRRKQASNRLVYQAM